MTPGNEPRGWQGPAADFLPAENIVLGHITAESISVPAVDAVVAPEAWQPPSAAAMLAASERITAKQWEDLLAEQAEYARRRTRVLETLIYGKPLEDMDEAEAAEAEKMMELWSHFRGVKHPDPKPAATPETLLADIIPERFACNGDHVLACCPVHGTHVAPGHPHRNCILR